MKPLHHCTTACVHAPDHQSSTTIFTPWRIMGFYALYFLGMSSAGNLISGLLANLFGAPVTVLIGMAICIAVALAIKTLSADIPSDTVD